MTGGDGLKSSDLSDALMPSAACNSLKRCERPVEDVQLVGEGRAESRAPARAVAEAGPASITTATLASGDQQQRPQ